MFNARTATTAKAATHPLLSFPARRWLASCHNPLCLLPLCQSSKRVHEIKRLRLMVGTAAGLAATVFVGRPHRSGPRSCTTCVDYLSQLEKPDSHRHRSYEYLQLQNGLQVILASEPSCDKAAAALCVGVGRLHEPKQIPGLAHFCEHMLFLGTEAFPDEAEYKKFIKGHGGKCNAATGDAQTCYVFDIAPGYLSGALDRFSQFFLSPLFTPSATEREINAVDSEHSMRITDDGRRSYASLLLDANPKHPLHWGSGNAQSLRDGPRSQGIDIHKEVVKFYKDCYSSEDMTLVVLGRESLADLRKMVEERFAHVRKTGVRALRGDHHGEDEPAIRPEQFSGIVLREPCKDMRSITFSWQLPCWQIPLWQSKPGAYATYLVGHEGEGSLLSALKAKGWATSLGAGVDEFGCFSHFGIGITLTEKGLDHAEEVGALVFQYLHLLRSTPVLPWVLSEMQKLRDIRFRFADDLQPYSLVNMLARNMQHYPPETVLSAPHKITSLDAEAAAGILERLTVDGVRVEFVAKRFGKQCTATDPWYGGQYLRIPLHEHWRTSWAAAAGDVDAKSVNSSDQSASIASASKNGLRLPRPNPFIPEDLSLRRFTKQDDSKIPIALKSSVAGISRSFHRQDDRFDQPKAILAFRFHSLEAGKDTIAYLKSRMWCSAVNEELNEYAYDATAAGLTYSLAAAPGGFELSVGGFNDKLPTLLRAVARKMRRTSAVSPETFEIVRDRYERSLKNIAAKQRPCDYAARKSRDLKRSMSFPVEDQLSALQQLRVSDLNGQNERLLSECEIDGLLMGNLRREEAINITEMLIEELVPPVPPVSLPQHAEAALPHGRTVWQLSGTSPEERNNNLHLELQIPANLENSVNVALLVRVLNPFFFKELRTEQQLGYIVQMSRGEGDGFLSVVCTVQSEYPPEYVRGRVEAFFQKRLLWIESELDEAEFVRQRDGLAANFAELPKNLREEFGRFWPEVAQLRYDFERRDRMRQALEVATLPSLRAFVNDVVRAAPRLYIEVHSMATGTKKEPPEDGTVAEKPDRVWVGSKDAQEFREKASWARAAGQEVGAVGLVARL